MFTAVDRLFTLKIKIFLNGLCQLHVLVLSKDNFSS